MNRTYLVFDNFLTDPVPFLAEARNAKFKSFHGHASNRGSDISRHSKRLKSRFAKLANIKVKWAEAGGSGSYRKTTLADVKKDRSELLVHSDGEYNFAGIIYLSQPKDCHGGTGFFRHKETGLQGWHDLEAIQLAMKRLKLSGEDLFKMIEKDAKSKRKWIMTDLVQMQFNRLILFNSARFHSHVYDFASVTPRSERLVLTAYGTAPHNF